MTWSCLFVRWACLLVLVLELENMRIKMKMNMVTVRNWGKYLDCLKNYSRFGRLGSMLWKKLFRITIWIWTKVKLRVMVASVLMLMAMGVVVLYFFHSRRRFNLPKKQKVKMVVMKVIAVEVVAFACPNSRYRCKSRNLPLLKCVTKTCGSGLSKLKLKNKVSLLYWVERRRQGKTEIKINSCSVVAMSEYEVRV